MLFCLIKNEENKEKIKFIKNSNEIIYFNNITKSFENDKGMPVNIENKKVLALCPRNYLQELIQCLILKKAKPVNGIKEIKQLLEWYKYIDVDYPLVCFKKRDLSDLAFLTYLREIFSDSQEVWLRVLEKDFMVLFNFLDIFDKNSVISQKIELLDDEDLIIFPDMKIDEDENGLIMYRAIIFNKKVIKVFGNDGQVVDDLAVQQYLEKFLNDLPKDFAKNFEIEIFVAEGQLYIKDIVPLEIRENFHYDIDLKEKNNNLSLVLQKNN